MFWADLLTRLAQSGMMSYKELKSLDVKEFFIILVNYEKRLEDGRSEANDIDQRSGTD